MNKIFHIPHASTYIPKEYKNTYLISEIELEDEISIMCDTRTDEMVENDKIVFPYSRVLCDVERFNSEEEIMNKIGMGVIYYKTHNLNPMRCKLTDKIYNELISLYDEHHKKLNDVCEEKLKDGNDVLFIDLHSYSNTPLRYELYKDKKRPNICIGINERYNKEILDKIISITERFGYTYSINEPFSGCLLPSNYINDDRVHGVMIEINKLIYNDEVKFEKIKEFLECIKNEI